MNCICDSNAFCFARTWPFACLRLALYDLLYLQYWWANVFQSLRINSKRAPHGWKLWSLLTMGAAHCANHYQLFIFTVQKYIYPYVSKVHAGSFRVAVIHRNLTWTTGSLTCVSDHSYACVCTWGLGTLAASQHNIFNSGKNVLVFIVLLTGFELGSLPDIIESWGEKTTDVLSTEPPRHLRRGLGVKN